MDSIKTSRARPSTDVIVDTECAMTKRPQKRHKYLVVRDWIAEQIASGEFAEGAQLPSEHELMARFAVSRVTARQALSDLKSSGLIEARRGKGYFVNQLTATSDLERLQSFGEMMAPLGLETSSNIIELSEVTADHDVANALALGVDAPLVKIVRTRSAGARVMTLSLTYLPHQLGKRVMCLDLANVGLCQLLEDRLGIELSYADTVVDSVKVDEPQGALIGVKAGQPVMRIQRTTCDGAGKPLFYETNFAPLEAIKFSIRVPRW